MDHGERKHALLSASGAMRWINCTPSARMEEEFPESSSSYADEGTLAHELANIDLLLAIYVGPVGKGSAKEKLKKEREELTKNELYQTEMEGYVEEYVSYVLEEYAAAKKKTPDAVLKVEEKTDYSYLVPEGFGTSDANIIADGALQVIDFKYGKGVRVEAENNSQIRLYGLGLLRKFRLLYDIDQVKLTIVQPRLYHLDYEVLNVEDLIKWSEEVVKPSALKAFEGKGEAKPGPWCRWCSAKPVCRALADQNLSLARHEFADPKKLSKEELAQVFHQLDDLTGWASSVASYMLEKALTGEKYPGLKVVEGRSNRKWLDEDKVKTRILSEKDEITEDQLVNVKMKGLGDIEKLLGKKLFNDILKDLVIKPQGKPSLVPESDKRPELNGIEQAKKDFSE